MAGGFYGADVAQLRLLAQQLEHGAQDLEAAVRVLGHQVMTTTQWQGRDADTFRGQWNGSHQPSVGVAVSGLRRAAAALARNAADQERASSAGAGAGSMVGVLPGGHGPSWGGGDAGPVSASPGGGRFSGEALIDHGVRAGVRTSGNAQVGPEGAAASIGVGAKAGFELDAHAKGSYGIGAAEVRGYAFVGARADAEASVAIGKEGLKASAGGAAFVGVEANVEGLVEIGGVTAGAEAGVMYGIGGRATIDGEIGFEKVEIDLDIGASLGLGVHFSPRIEFSPRELVEDLGALVWNPLGWW